MITALLAQAQGVQSSDREPAQIQEKTPDPSTKTARTPKGLKTPKAPKMAQKGWVPRGPPYALDPFHYISPPDLSQGPLGNTLLPHIPIKTRGLPLGTPAEHGRIQALPARTKVLTVKTIAANIRTQALPIRTQTTHVRLQTVPVRIPAGPTRTRGPFVTRPLAPELGHYTFQHSLPPALTLLRPQDYYTNFIARQDQADLVKDQDPIDGDFISILDHRIESNMLRELQDTIDLKLQDNPVYTISTKSLKPHKIKKIRKQVKTPKDLGEGGQENIHSQSLPFLSSFGMKESYPRCSLNFRIKLAGVLLYLSN